MNPSCMISPYALLSLNTSFWPVSLTVKPNKNTVRTTNGKVSFVLFGFVIDIQVSRMAWRALKLLMPEQMTIKRRGFCESSFEFKMHSSGFGIIDVEFSGST